MRGAVAALVSAVTVVLSAAPVAAADDVTPAPSAAQQRANRAAARLAKAETALAVAEREVTELEGRLAGARLRLQSSQDGVRLLALEQYVGRPATRLLFFDRDVNQRARARALLEYATRSTGDAVRRYRSDKEDLEELRSGVVRRLGDQRKALRSLQEERADATEELERLAAAERALEARRAVQQRVREQKTRSTAAPQPARAEAASPRPPTERAASPPPAPAPAPAPAAGGWVCPVHRPRAFSNDFGAPRAGGRSHQGNDILAPRGTPVVANVSGTVSRHSSNLGGLSYYLRGSDGVTYVGAHLDSYAASGPVSAGTVIGTVGDTGDARGGPPHLHFEMHRGGTVVNPYSTLVKHC